MSGPPTAALIVIGNEVLNGKVVDANTPVVIEELRKLGVSLRRIVVVQDEVETIAHEVRAAAASHDWVFTSGGLGPTHDDLTIDAVALAFDRKVVTSEILTSALENIRNGRDLEKLRRLARVPEGCEYFWGHGSERWPTVYVSNTYIFPGVPAFFRARFGGLRDLLKARPFVTGSIYTTLNETELVEALDATVAAHPWVEIGSYPRFFEPDYKVRLTFDALDAVAVDAAMADFRDRVPAETIVRTERE